MAYFDASLEGVKGLLPHREFTATTKPSAEQVEGFVAVMAGRVAARIRRTHFDDVEPPPGTDAAEFRASLLLMARSAAELGAAAMAQDAAFPEKAGPADTSYGSTLWARHTSTVDELLEALAMATGGDGAASDPGAVSSPEAKFPPALFRRAQGW